MLIGLMAILCTGCASDWVRQQAAYERNIQHTEKMLIAAGDADSLAAAAMLSVGPKADPMQRLTLIARAVEKAPDRPDLVWLNVRFCAQVDSCNPEPLQAHFLALDPDNGAAWLDAIARAAKANDEAAVHKTLEAIAASARFDIYWNATIVHVTTAIVNTRSMDLPTAVDAINGVAAALTIPPYQPILNACKGDFLKDPVVVATCRRVASVMRRGDTYMTEMVGVGIAKRAWPDGSTEFLDAVNAKRVAHYRIHVDGQVAIQRARNARYAAKRLQLMTENKTEQGVSLAEIIDAKLSPNPPSDWTDKWDGS